MKVEIWSDVVCPWCYVGKRRFESALDAFPHKEGVEVVWRSFELDPNAPRVREGAVIDHLAAKYGVSHEEAQAMQQRVVEAAAAEGLELRFDRARGGNTFDAHRLLHLAAAHGLQGELKERLLRAYFSDGRPVGDAAALRDVAVEAGLAAGEVDDVLGSDRYGDAVRADEAEARALGAGAVPFFVIDRAYGLSGAHPAQVFTNMLERAWAETHDDAAEAAPGAAASA